MDEERATEHPAIMITGLYPEGLTEKEQEVYGLILGRMLEAFIPAWKRKLHCRHARQLHTYLTRLPHVE